LIDSNAQSGQFSMFWISFSKTSQFDVHMTASVSIQVLIIGWWCAIRDPESESFQTRTKVTLGRMSCRTTTPFKGVPAISSLHTHVDLQLNYENLSFVKM